MEELIDQPDAVLLIFVDGLPDTIRDIIIPQACIAYGRFEARPGFDYRAAFAELLRTRDDSWRMFDVARMVGVIETLLIIDPLHRTLHEKLAAEHQDVEFFAVSALQAPLKEKHYERARDDFHLLREGPLSPSALRLWWLHLQAEDQRQVNG